MVRAVASVAVLGMAGLGLSACGSSSSSGGAGNAAATTASTTGSAADSSPTDVASTATTAATAAATVPDTGGGSFCALARNQKELTDQQTAAAGLATDTPTQLQAYFTSAINEIKTVIHEAPSAIKPALGQILVAEQTLESDLQSLGFDFTKVTATTFSNLNQTGLTASAQTIGEYLAAHCGIPYTPPATN